MLMFVLEVVHFWFLVLSKLDSGIMQKLLMLRYFYHTFRTSTVQTILLSLFSCSDEVEISSFLKTNSNCILYLKFFLLEFHDAFLPVAQSQSWGLLGSHCFVMQGGDVVIFFLCIIFIILN